MSDTRTGRPGWLVAGATVRTMAGDLVTVLEVREYSLPGGPRIGDRLNAVMARVQWSDGAVETVPAGDLREAK